MNANIYEKNKSELKQSGIKFLPSTLTEALDAFEEDPLTERVFGEMKGIFLKQKRWEWEASFFPIAREQFEKNLTHI